MNNHRAHPKLRKRHITTLYGRSIFGVNAYAVRDTARPDEEFGNFATCDEFRDLIPPGQVWLSDKNWETEGLFFIANAITRLEQAEQGAAEETAYDAGIEVERALREKVNGIKFRDGRPHKRVPHRVYVERYTTIPDERFPVDVWVVDGNVVRSYYKTDYTEGGHGYVYPWVPKREIWVERALDPAELPFIVAHEYTEHRLMRDKGVEYDPAHEICSKVEFKLRRGAAVKEVFVPGGRPFGKADLPRLTSHRYFDYVVNRYVRGKSVSRA